MVLEKTLESPLDCKEIKPVNPKGYQLWIFIGRTDAEADAPILWLLDAKSQLIGKDSDAGKDWEQEENGATKELDGWVASPTQWTWVWENSRDSEGQGCLVCWSPRGCKELDIDWVTEQQEKGTASGIWQVYFKFLPDIELDGMGG